MLPDASSGSSHAYINIYLQWPESRRWIAEKANPASRLTASEIEQEPWSYPSFRNPGFWE